MELKQLKHKYEMIPELILEECWKEAQKELLEELALFCENKEIVIDERYLRERKLNLTNK